VSAALLLLYYCFTTALLLLYYCFTTADLHLFLGKPLLNCQPEDEEPEPDASRSLHVYYGRLPQVLRRTTSFPTSAYSALLQSLRRLAPYCRGPEAGAGAAPELAQLELRQKLDLALQLRQKLELAQLQLLLQQQRLLLQEQ
jgi:hypothetical protein